MSAAAHRAEYDALRERVIRESGLGRPAPYVSTEIADLLVTLLSELGACLLELELAEALRATL
jgi:hypothetical protein